MGNLIWQMKYKFVLSFSFFLKSFQYDISNMLFSSFSVHVFSPFIVFRFNILRMGFFFSFERCQNTCISLELFLFSFFIFVFGARLFFILWNIIFHEPNEFKLNIVPLWRERCYFCCLHLDVKYNESTLRKELLAFIMAQCIGENGIHLSYSICVFSRWQIVPNCRT